MGRGGRGRRSGAHGGRNTSRGSGSSRASSEKGKARLEELLKVRHQGHDGDKNGGSRSLVGGRGRQNKGRGRGKESRSDGAWAGGGRGGRGRGQRRRTRRGGTLRRGRASDGCDTLLWRGRDDDKTAARFGAEEGGVVSGAADLATDGGVAARGSPVTGHAAAAATGLGREQRRAAGASVAVPGAVAANGRAIDARVVATHDEGGKKGKSGMMERRQGLGVDGVGAAVAVLLFSLTRSRRQ